MLRAFLAGCAVVIVVIIMVTMGLSMFSIAKGPKSFFAKAIVAGVEDEVQAGNIIDEGVAVEIPCGQIVRKSMSPYTGKSRFYYDRDPVTEGLRCYKSEGFSRDLENTKLKVVTGDIVKEIAEKKEYYPNYPGVLYGMPPPARYGAQAPAPPAPAPTPVTVATPIPEVGVRCCTQ